VPEITFFAPVISEFQCAAVSSHRANDLIGSAKVDSQSAAFTSDMNSWRYGTTWADRTSITIVWFSEFCPTFLAAECGMMGQPVIGVIRGFHLW